MNDENGKKVADVVDLSRMYVGPQQRQVLFERAYQRYRAKGFSNNQSAGLATQAVNGFVAKMDQERRAAAKGEENE